MVSEKGIEQLVLRSAWTGLLYTQEKFAAGDAGCTWRPTESESGQWPEMSARKTRTLPDQSRLASYAPKQMPPIGYFRLHIQLAASSLSDSEQ